MPEHVQHLPHIITILCILVQSTFASVPFGWKHSVLDKSSATFQYVYSSNVQSGNLHLTITATVRSPALGRTDSYNPSTENYPVGKKEELEYGSKQYTLAHSYSGNISHGEVSFARELGISRCESFRSYVERALCSVTCGRGWMVVDEYCMRKGRWHYRTQGHLCERPPCNDGSNQHPFSRETRACVSSYSDCLYEPFQGCFQYDLRQCSGQKRVLKKVLCKKSCGNKAHPPGAKSAFLRKFGLLETQEQSIVMMELT